MADSSIQWTDKVWNPVVGCARVSAGCGASDGGGCYAERMAHRLSTMPHTKELYAGLTRMTKGGPRWTGIARPVPERLIEPLHWTKPKRVFVNSMSDLFHEDVSDRFIAAVFHVMAQASRHQFQVLTKRPERMRAWFAWLQGMLTTDRGFSDLSVDALCMGIQMRQLAWPLPNVWLGVSVENQATADERIPLLLETPAAVRWVSYEPAIGPVDFSRWMMSADERTRRQSDAYWKFCRQANAKPPSMADPAAYAPSLSWLVCGGESGPGARPFDLAWARSAIQQCKAADVPVFTKQVGARPYQLRDEGDPHPLREPLKLADRKGGTMDEWPEDLQVREFPR